jgi:hypothetical protein
VSLDRDLVVVEDTRDTVVLDNSDPNPSPGLANKADAFENALIHAATGSSAEFGCCLFVRFPSDSSGI